jgi:hypothetical protein
MPHPHATQSFTPSALLPPRDRTLSVAHTSHPSARSHSTSSAEPLCAASRSLTTSCAATASTAVGPSASIVLPPRIGETQMTFPLSDWLCMDTGYRVVRPLNATTKGREDPEKFAIHKISIYRGSTHFSSCSNATQLHCTALLHSSNEQPLLTYLSPTGGFFTLEVTAAHGGHHGGIPGACAVLGRPVQPAIPLLNATLPWQRLQSSPHRSPGKDRTGKAHSVVGESTPLRGDSVMLKCQIL